MGCGTTTGVASTAVPDAPPVDADDAALDATGSDLGVIDLGLGVSATDAGVGDVGDADPPETTPVVDASMDSPVDTGVTAPVDGGACAVDAAVISGSDCAVCGGVSVDRSLDELNCGSCGNVCDAGAFCARGHCTDLTLANLCSLPRATVIDDGLSDDLDAAATLTTLLVTCAPSVLVDTMSQSSAASNGTLDSTSFRPTLGRGDLLVLAGGSYGQHAVAYLETDATPVYFRYDATTYTFALRSTDASIVTAPTTSVTAHQDWFVAELVSEPTSKTVSLISYAFGGAGTSAGAWWIGHVALTAATCCGQWYVVEWVDTDGDSLPSAADAFTIVGAG
jgi:hypothetical protein